MDIEWWRKNFVSMGCCPPLTLIIWHRLQGITRGVVPLCQLSSCASFFCSHRKAICRSISSISFCKSVFLSVSSRMDLSMSWNSIRILMLLLVLFIYSRTNPNHAILPPICYKCPAQLQEFIISLLLWLCQSESLNPPGWLQFCQFLENSCWWVGHTFVGQIWELWVYLVWLNVTERV